MTGMIHQRTTATTTRRTTRTIAPTSGSPATSTQPNPVMMEVAIATTTDGKDGEIIATGSTDHHSSTATTITTTTTTTATMPQLFLHISPAGDCWVGPGLFAAKHLQPDYVRSIPVTWLTFKDEDGDDGGGNGNGEPENEQQQQSQTNDFVFVEWLENNPTVAQQLYDAVPTLHNAADMMQFWQRHAI